MDTSIAQNVRDYTNILDLAHEVRDYANILDIAHKVRDYANILDVAQKVRENAVYHLEKAICLRSSIVSRHLFCWGFGRQSFFGHGRGLWLALRLTV